MGARATPQGPDLASDGVPVADLRPGAMVAGRVGDAPVVLVRTAEGIHAIGGRCTHHGTELGDGVFDGETVRCPNHHACFDIITGRALKAPALDPVPVYDVVESGGILRVTAPRIVQAATEAPPAPDSVTIVGGGAAAMAAAEELRSEGFTGPITVISADPDGPPDRPNLSKDYLAGEAPEEWIPLRSSDHYAARGIDLRLGTVVERFDPKVRELTLSSGDIARYDALLLATGASAVRLPLPGAELPHVFTLRTPADSRAIVDAAVRATGAVVIGASFIGLEVAASLRHRGLPVAVVAPDEVPMARVLGDEVGAHVRRLHEAHGVEFHLGRKPASVEERQVILDDGTALSADLVVMGVGVRPELRLAEEAGIEVDRGVVVDEYLATSAPQVWAAGDIARWPDPRVGPIRVEHWVVAQRMGQTVAHNILGRRRPFTDVPFFWSQHYDVTIRYVGHAEAWDEAAVAGSLENRDAVIGYRQNGRILAVATVGRDTAALEAEIAFERNDHNALERITGR